MSQSFWIWHKHLLMALFILCLIPYIFILKSLLLVKLDHTLKSAPYYPNLSKNKVLSKLFYFLINLYFLFWNHVFGNSEEAIIPNEILKNLKNLFLALSTSLTSILLVNSFLTIAEPTAKTQNSSLMLAARLIKIVIYCAITAVATHYIFGVSPYSLITSIGITTGLFIVLFKDAILGLIASVQWTLTDSLRIGDEVCFQQYNIQGTVENLSPFMIKLRHLDGAISAVPCHMLLSSCLKNFRDKHEKTNKTIKTIFEISTSSVVTFDNSKSQELCEKYNLKESKLSSPFTNISIFRILLERFALDKNHIQGISFAYGEKVGSNVLIEICLSVSLEYQKCQILRSEVLEHCIHLANQLRISLV